MSYSATTSCVSSPTVTTHRTVDNTIYTQPLKSLNSTKKRRSAVSIVTEQHDQLDTILHTLNCYSPSTTLQHRHKKQQLQLILCNNTYFAQLSHNVRNKLIDAFYLRTVYCDTILQQEDAYIDMYYIVQSGTVSINNTAVQCNNTTAQTVLQRRKSLSSLSHIQNAQTNSVQSTLLSRTLSRLHDRVTNQPVLNKRRSSVTQQCQRFATVGDTLGDLALLHTYKSSDTWRAMTDCTVWCIELSQVRSIIQQAAQQRYKQLQHFYTAHCQLNWLQTLNSNDIDALIDSSNMVQYKYSDHVIHCAQSVHTLYIVSSGCLQCTGDELTCKLPQGSMFAAFDIAQYTQSATPVKTPTTARRTVHALVSPLKTVQPIKRTKVTVLSSHSITALTGKCVNGTSAQCMLVSDTQVISSTAHIVTINLAALPNHLLHQIKHACSGAAGQSAQAV